MADLAEIPDPEMAEHVNDVPPLLVGGQVRADAARILKLDYLPDLRELTRADAAELIAELRRALAQERVGGDL